MENVKFISIGVVVFLSLLAIAYRDRFWVRFNLTRRPSRKRNESPVFTKSGRLLGLMHNRRRPKNIKSTYYDMSVPYGHICMASGEGRYGTIVLHWEGAFWSTSATVDQLASALGDDFRSRARQMRGSR